MTDEPEIAVSSAVQYDEVHDRASGLFFRSFFPNPTAHAPWARLALLHGYGDHGSRYGHVLNGFAARGISCTSLDFRGHGRSLGRRGYVQHWIEFLDNLDTFLAWERSASAAHSRGEPLTPLFVIGHSHGGLVAAAAAIVGRLNSAAGCILSSPYLRARTPLSGVWPAVAWLTNRLAPWISIKSGLTAEMMSSDPCMQADANRDPLLVHGATPRWYMETLAVQARTMRSAENFRLPMLCLAGDADSVADPAAAEQFVGAAGSSDKTLIRYPGKLHELLRETGREAIIQTIFDWMHARAGS
jgi:lysophospholipase